MATASEPIDRLIEEMSAALQCLHASKKQLEALIAFGDQPFHVVTNLDSKVSVMKIPRSVVQSIAESNVNTWIAKFNKLAEMFRSATKVETRGGPTDL